MSREYSVFIIEFGAGHFQNCVQRFKKIYQWEKDGSSALSHLKWSCSHVRHLHNVFNLVLLGFRVTNAVDI